MSLKRKLIIKCVECLIVMLSVCIFNANFDTVYINFAALAILGALYLFRRKIFPSWIIDYFSPAD